MNPSSNFNIPAEYQTIKRIPSINTLFKKRTHPKAHNPSRPNAYETFEIPKVNYTRHDLHDSNVYCRRQLVLYSNNLKIFTRSSKPAIPEDLRESCLANIKNVIKSIKTWNFYLETYIKEFEIFTAAQLSLNQCGGWQDNDLVFCPIDCRGNDSTKTENQYQCLES
jgi:hypothetical protein